MMIARPVGRLERIAARVGRLETHIGATVETRTAIDELFDVGLGRARVHAGDQHSFSHFAFEQRFRRHEPHIASRQRHDSIGLVDPFHVRGNARHEHDKAERVRGEEHERRGEPGSARM